MKVSPSAVRLPSPVRRDSGQLWPVLWAFHERMDGGSQVVDGRWFLLSQELHDMGGDETWNRLGRGERLREQTAMVGAT